MAQIVIEVPDAIAAKYNGQAIEFFKRQAHSEYGKMVKGVARVLDEKELRKLGRLNVLNPNVIREVFPKLEKIFAQLKNVQILSVLNFAMAAANLMVTVQGFEEINRRLDNIEAQLTEIKQGIDKLQAQAYELDIAKPCRVLVSKYKDISDLYQKGKPINEKELISLIDECKEYIISMYNLRSNYPLDVVLSIIFRLFPAFANCIIFYYHRFYDPNQHKHNRHGEWMEVFDILNAPRFIDEIQDDMFIRQIKTNREVNEYLDCHRAIVYGYKQKIEDMLEGMKDCGSVEAYDEAMRWSRQYAAQQAKSVQNELVAQYGAAKAQEIMAEAGLA